MNKKLSIVYITCRREPMFEWFVETLISQYENKVVTDQIIFIDSFFCYDDKRGEKLIKIVNGRFNYTHTSAKPSIWRGEHKITRCNFFDASGTRNTGIILSENEHIVFVDDLSALADGWLNHHRKAAEDKIILCGAYDKVSDIVISNGSLTSYNGSNCDHRFQKQTSDEKIKIPGGWVFGQNVSFPFEFLERINGYDEFFARRGCEDCNLGIRLELAGYSDLMFYNKNCLIVEDEKMHWSGINEVDDTYPRRAWKLGQEKNENVTKDLNKIMREIESKNLYVDKNFKTIDTYFNLKEERELWQKTKTFKPINNIEHFDFDGENIRDI